MFRQMKMRLRSWKMLVTTWLVAMMLLLPVTATAQDTLSDDEQKLLEIYQLLKIYHLNAPDDDSLMQEGIEAMIESLNDPYTVYLSEEEYNQFTNDINGSYVGIGIMIGMEDEYIIITHVFEGSPAEQAGIEPGDKIIAVNGKDVVGKTTDEVSVLIRGPEGEEVELTTIRDGQTYTRKMKRAMIELPLVESELLESGVGYIQVLSFGDNVHEKMTEHRSRLESEGIDGLIIDLKNNGGGYLDPALRMAESFVASDRELMHVKNNREVVNTYISEGEQYDKPVVILVNEYSASASEMFTGALRDNGVAKVVGTRSFGKGTVQELVPLYSGGVLKLTVEEYFTPNHTPIHGIGIFPDIVAEDHAQQLVIAEAIIQGNAVLELAEDGTITLNGTELTSSVPVAVQQQGEWYASPRALTALYGGKVSWDGTNRTVQVTVDGGETKSYSVDDSSLTVLQNGTSYIKLNTLLQDFAQWQPYIKQVEIARQ